MSSISAPSFKDLAPVEFQFENILSELSSIANRPNPSISPSEDVRIRSKINDLLTAISEKSRDYDKAVDNVYKKLHTSETEFSFPKFREWLKGQGPDIQHLKQGEQIKIFQEISLALACKNDADFQRDLTYQRQFTPLSRRLGLIQHIIAGVVRGDKETGKLIQEYFDAKAPALNLSNITLRQSTQPSISQSQITVLTTAAQKPESITFSSPKKACKVFYDVGWGKSLGVCFAPNWKPVAFTYERVSMDGKEYHAWNGQLPIGTAFKFVKLDENNEISAWETGEDRYAFSNSSGVSTFSSEQMRF